MTGTCFMGTPDEIRILFGKIDQLVKVTGNTNIAIEGMRGDVRVLASQVEHKAEKDDISRDIYLHATECMTRGQRGGGIWAGMSPTQKTAFVGFVLTTTGSIVMNVIQNL